MSNPSLSIVLKYAGIVVILVFFYFYYKRKAGREQEQAAERRTSYIKSHEDLSDETRSALSEGKILEGMTEEELVASVGFPLRRNVLTMEPARSEELIYPSFYVLLHMGIVQSWKEQKKLSGLQ